MYVPFDPAGALTPLGDMHNYVAPPPSQPPAIPGDSRTSPPHMSRQLYPIPRRIQFKCTMHMTLQCTDHPHTTVHLLHHPCMRATSQSQLCNQSHPLRAPFAQIRRYTSALPRFAECDPQAVVSRRKESVCRPVLASAYWNLARGGVVATASQT